MDAHALKRDMLWGVAISAAQTESSVDADGKGPSIWDAFSEKKKSIFSQDTKIRNNDSIANSCDFYNLYETDIELVKKIGFKHFRFSIAWSRIYPDGVTYNPLGMDYYKNLIDACIEQGITPWVTLYHWDLPLALEKKGGWASRDIIGYFQTFAETCIRQLPQIKNWILLNEPSVFLGAGYLFGIHAPGKKSFNGFFAATHHAMLSIGHVYRHLKNINPDLNIGSSFSFTQIENYNESAKERKAAETADLLINRFSFEPIIGLGYPSNGPAKMNKIHKYLRVGDEQNLNANLDFIGIQTYTKEVFKHNPFNPFIKIKHVPAYERSIDLTAMHWEMVPESIYHCIQKVHAYGLDTPLIITENGVAFDDKPMLNKVSDVSRIHFYQSHIGEVLRAKADGANVKGYFAWSLLDNFEWAEGYYPRFGLVYVDFETKQRILKDSAYWFKKFLASF